MSDIISYVGILISILFFIEKQNEEKYFSYLSGLYIIISLHALLKNNLVDNKFIDVHLLNPIVLPLFFCSGPFIYLFIKKVFADDKDQNLRIYEYLYFLPVVIAFINFSPQYFLSPKEFSDFYQEQKLNPFYILKIKHLWFSLTVNTFLRVIYSLIFGTAAILLVFKNSAKIKIIKSRNISKNFIYSLICIYLIQNLIFLLIILSVQINKTTDFSKLNNTQRFFLEAYTFCSILMILLFFLFPKMFFGISNVHKFLNLNTNKNLVNPDFQGGQKPEDSFKVIGEKLNTYFESKPFLETGFDISTISKNTKIPYNQISLFYQVYLKVSFSDWKNSERIKHAKDLFCSGQAEKFTIEAIALRCGYLSRSNFISAFKKHVGVSPSVFIKNTKNIHCNTIEM